MSDKVSDEELNRSIQEIESFITDNEETVLDPDNEEHGFIYLLRVSKELKAARAEIKRLRGDRDCEKKIRKDAEDKRDNVKTCRWIRPVGEDWYYPQCDEAKNESIHVTDWNDDWIGCPYCMHKIEIAS